MKDRTKTIRAIESSQTKREAADKLGYSTQYLDVKLKKWQLKVIKDIKLKVVEVTIDAED